MHPVVTEGGRRRGGGSFPENDRGDEDGEKQKRDGGSPEGRRRSDKDGNEFRGECERSRWRGPPVRALLAGGDHKRRTLAATEATGLGEGKSEELVQAWLGEEEVLRCRSRRIPFKPGVVKSGNQSSERFIN